MKKYDIDIIYDGDEEEEQDNNVLIDEYEKIIDKNNDIDMKNRMRYMSSNITYDNLIDVCSKKISIEHNNRKALYIRSSTYLKIGRYYDTLDDCNRLISIDSKYAGAYYIRGCAYEKLNEYDKALDDYTAVLSIDPYHVNSVFARGTCLNKMVCD